MKNKNFYKKILASLCLAAMLFAFAACSGNSTAPEDAPEDAPISVNKVENVPDDFILGMDISSVISEEASGVKYFGFDGNEQDIFKTLADAGVTHIRVRVWYDPYDENGHGYGGGNCDAERACEIGRRAAEYGLKLIVDFHYSDFWADPGKQKAPMAFNGMSTDDKVLGIFLHTVSCLSMLKEAGAGIAVVQIGNETNGAFCGETEWKYIAELLKAGSRAVREECPGALVALHFTNPEKSGSFEYYAKTLDEYSVDYDVFATSYYPYWHGTLDNLASELSGVAKTYGKKVMVMETSYAYTADDTDFSGNTVSEGDEVPGYPFTVQGQADFVRDVIDTVVNKTENGIGVVYWEGAWISVGTESREKNQKIWEEYGSGWASSFAGEYDPDAALYYGGSAVDNQAFFDPTGKPLESLNVFNLIK